MKYFELLPDIHQLNQGLFANFVDEEQWGSYSWISGVKIKEKINVSIQYIMTIQGESKNFPPENLEFFGTGHGEILIHNRAKKIFEALTKYHTMYKSEIEYQGKKLPGPYYTINLETLRSAMNMDKSEYDYYGVGKIKDKISVIEHLVLSKEKLAQIPKDEHLFRLEEYTPITIIDEYGKNLIEEAGVVGVEFQELEVAE